MRAASVDWIRRGVALLVLVVPALCLGDVVSNVGPTPPSKPVDPVVAELFDSARIAKHRDELEAVRLSERDVALRLRGGPVRRVRSSESPRPTGDGGGAPEPD